MKFNLKRFRNIMQRDFYMDFLPTLKIMGIIIAIIFLLFAVNIFFNDDSDDFEIIANFGVFLFIAGVIYTSLAFGEFKTISGRAEYLALPTSHIEKLLSKWIYTNPAYILSISLIFLVLSVILIPILKFAGASFTNEIFTSDDYWRIVGYYFIIHSVFFVGSVTFNKNSLLKTLITLVVIAILAGLANLLVFRMIWYDYFEGLWTFQAFDGQVKFVGKFEDFENIPQVRFIVFMFQYIMAPVLWVVSFFKLTEKEV